MSDTAEWSSGSSWYPCSGANLPHYGISPTLDCVSPWQKALLPPELHPDASLIGQEMTGQDLWKDKITDRLQS